MAVEGTTVRAESTRTGVALVFTTTGDVDELRRRVHAHAERRAQHARHRVEHRDEQRRGHSSPRASATVETIRGGARLVLTPSDPANLEALRTRTRQKVERMTARRAAGNR
jgi:hypothetical protein